MRERGIDLSGIRPQRLTLELAARASLLITMGCGEECPIVPGAEREEWVVDDPAGKPPETVRRIREDIRERVSRLVRARGWARKATPPDESRQRSASV
jgi:arsenate reductase